MMGILSAIANPLLYGYFNQVKLCQFYQLPSMDPSMDPSIDPSIDQPQSKFDTFYQICTVCCCLRLQNVYSLLLCQIHYYLHIIKVFSCYVIKDSLFV